MEDVADRVETWGERTPSGVTFGGGSCVFTLHVPAPVDRPHTRRVMKKRQPTLEKLERLDEAEPYLDRIDRESDVCTEWQARAGIVRAKVMIRRHDQ